MDGGEGEANTDLPYRILTVGDGDLSLSLAVVRAYAPAVVKLTATTLLPSESDLLATYPKTAPGILKELKELHSVNVLYGVDACRLHENSRLKKNDGSSSSSFDLVLFHHPHTGETIGGGGAEGEGVSEAASVRLHASLLAHYLRSARSVAKRVHVALRGGGGGGDHRQAGTWRLREAAARAGLRECPGSPLTVAAPLHRLFGGEMAELRPRAASYAPASRRSRWAKHSSRHWLSRYGYQHVRTNPNHHHSSNKRAPPDMSGSYHYVFEAADDGMPPPTASIDAPTTTTTCAVCDARFENSERLQAHLRAPAASLVPVATPPPDGMPADLSGGDASGGASDDGASVSLTDGRINGTFCATDRNGMDQNVRASGHGKKSSPSHDRRRSGEAISWRATVDQANGGKRLRWYLQHHCTDPKQSKRAWERCITAAAGRVRVNGAAALDSARILRTGDQVSVVEVEQQQQQKGVKVEIVDRWTDTSLGDCVVVAWKPVGMRTMGHFDESTLERTVSRQLRDHYVSLSKLDTGCSGLCVLAPRRHDGDGRSASDDAPATIKRTFTALVHGRVPESWKTGVSIRLPVDEMRRWNKSVTGQHEALLRCVDQTHIDCESAPALSTVQVSTDSTASSLASTIAFYLRKTTGHRVVGDRFAVKEYAALPRSIRNRLKHRLCMGCTRVEISDHHHTGRSIPDRWRASYWQEHCSNSSTWRDYHSPS